MEAIQQHKGAIIYEQRDSSAYTVVEQAEANEVSPVITNKREMARFWPRWFAFSIDNILSLITISLVGALFVAAVGIELEEGDYLNPYFVLYFITSKWAYNALMESKMGGTLGKLLVKLRVVDKEGQNISLGRATLRFFTNQLANRDTGP